VVNAAPVELADVRDIRQFVPHSRSKQQLPALQPVSPAQRQIESALIAPGRLYETRPYLDSVRLKLIPRDLQEFVGMDTIAREIPVQPVRGSIPRFAFIADENAPPASA
jgi:hypothetical protein